MSDKNLILPRLTQTSLLTFTPTKSSSLRYSHSPFSLKPEKYIIPKDIPSNIIYQSMLKEVSTRSPPLNSQTKIGDLLLQHRYNIIIKMKEFIIANSISTSIIFTAIYYLDYLISLNCSSLSIDLLNLLGVGSLILSLKFNELEVCNPPMSHYQGVYSDVFYSMDDILQMELLCLRQFNYKLSHVEPIHFLQILLLNGIVFNTDTKRDNGSSVSASIYNLPFHVLEITMESIEYMESQPLYIACACVAVSREYHSLDKWSGLLDTIFSIKFASFESEYTFVKR